MAKKLNFKIKKDKKIKDGSLWKRTKIEYHKEKREEIKTPKLIDISWNKYFGKKTEGK